MTDISSSLRSDVIDRAGNRCEYCQLSQEGQDVPLFNPRTQVWSEHFRWEGEVVIPLTSTGRATVAALAMNRPLILAIRREEIMRGRHPANDG